MSASERAADLHLLWRQHLDCLYDLVFCAPLQWPSLSVDWVPGSRVDVDASRFSQHQLVLGTQTSGHEPNGISVEGLYLPRDSSECNIQDGSREDDEALPADLLRPEILPGSSWLPHNGDVNRARCMQEVASGPRYIAACTDSGDVTLHLLPPSDLDGGAEAELPDPEIIQVEGPGGFGLCWSPTRVGWLLSGSSNGAIRVWDTGHDKGATMVWSNTGPATSGPSADEVQWHPSELDVFASVHENGEVAVWDVRSRERVQSWRAPGAKGLLSCDYNKLAPSELAVGGVEALVVVYDVRTTKQPLHRLRGHTSDVGVVRWNPFIPGVLATGGDMGDSRVILWDIQAIAGSVVQKPHGVAGGGLPPHVLFVHAGHLNAVNDVAWSPHDPWTLASTSSGTVDQDVSKDEEGTGLIEPLQGPMLHVWRIHRKLRRR